MSLQGTCGSWRVAVLIAAVITATATRAETLEEAWEAALAVDGRFAAATSRSQANEAALAAARAERLPIVTASAAASVWRDTPAFDFGGMGIAAGQPLFPGDTLNVASAQVSLPLYMGGALAANVAAAEADRDGQALSTNAVRQDLKFAVAAAYIGVLRAASALEVARSETASLAAHARDIEDMRSTGQVPTNDYLAAAVSLADAQQRQLTAQSALDIARALYNRRVGRPFETPVDLEPLVAPLGGPETAASLPALVAAARAARPELAQLDAAADALAARALAARAARRPQLALNGGYAYVENAFLNREDFWFVALGVRINVFDSGRSRHTSAALERQSAAVADDRRDRESDIELEVHRGSADLATARARLDVAAGAVQQAEENLRVVRDRYRNGEGTNTEVLDAEALRAQSAGNFDTARYDLRLAELALARSLGTL
jgi:outer membrane protein TolC